MYSKQKTFYSISAMYPTEDVNSLWSERNSQ